MALSVRDRVGNAVKALMGISTFSNDAVSTGYAIDPAKLDEIRKRFGGNIQRLPVTTTRWLLEDLEIATHEADAGQLARIGRLWRAMKRDGYIGGLTKTRTSGLVSLPKQFRGRDDVVQELRAENGTRSVFDEMFPPQELAALAADGLGVGVGLAEMIPVVGRDYPVMVRYDPEWLIYRWADNRWYYQSIAGLIPITPGDGRWILHMPGGRMYPWQQGLWPSLGRAYVLKEHAMLMRSNYSSKLANPARVATAPQGATDDQRLGWMQKVMAWGINSVFEALPGWDVKLLESNGRGWEVFGTEIDTSNFEIMIALAGQVVTVTGGTGFANASIHQTIRADLIKETADALAHTINTQGLPPWVVKRFGIDALGETPRIEWDVAPPADRTADAQTLTAVAQAITTLRPVLAAGDITLDVDELVARYRLPVKRGVTPPEIEEPGTTPPNVPAPENDTSDGESDGSDGDS